MLLELDSQCAELPHLTDVCKMKTEDPAAGDNQTNHHAMICIIYCSKKEGVLDTVIIAY